MVGRDACRDFDVVDVRHFHDRLGRRAVNLLADVDQPLDDLPGDG